MTPIASIRTFCMQMGCSELLGASDPAKGEKAQHSPLPSPPHCMGLAIPSDFCGTTVTSSGHGDPAYFVPRASLRMLCLCYVKNGLQSTEGWWDRNITGNAGLFNSKTLCYPKRLKMKSERSAQGAGEVWGQKNNTDWEYFGEGICGRGRTALGLPLVTNPKPKIWRGAAPP